MREEIKIPNYKRLPIFADCETGTQMDDPNYDYTPREETNQELRENGKVIPWLMGVSWRPFTKLGERLFIEYREEVIFLEEQHKFFEYLGKVFNLKKMVPLIICHNTSYDFTALAETVWRDLDPDLVYDMHVKDQNHDFIFGKMHSPKYGFRCLFGDTMQYERLPLSKAAAIMGMEKGEIPYSMAEVWVDAVEDLIYFIDMKTGGEARYPLSKCVDYCKNDVKICRLYYEYLKNYKHKTNFKILKYEPKKNFSANTQGKHALSLVSHWMKHDLQKDFYALYRTPIDKEEYTRQRMGFCGGFTSFNKYLKVYDCKEGEVIGSFDVNSMYPFIMSEGTPYGPLMEETPEHGDFITWILVEMVEPLRGTGCMEFLNTPPIPDTKLNTQTFYILEELFMFLKPVTSGKLKVIKSYYQRINQMLRPYFEARYEERQVIKARIKQATGEELEGLKQEEKGIKIAINSIYGKLGEKTHENTVRYIDGEFQLHENEVTEYRSTISGNYVCWMGRFMIYKQIKKVAELGYKVLYADTDSIKMVFPESDEQKVKKLFGTEFDKMGQWKDEGRFHFFSCPKRKKYILINKEKPSKSVLAFSGITNAKKGCEKFTHNLRDNTEETFKELQTIFSPDHNVRFDMAKTTTILTRKHAQKIIKNTHYHTNPKIKQITARIVESDDPKGYKFEWVNGKE